MSYGGLSVPHAPVEWAYWYSRVHDNFPVDGGVRRNPALAALRVEAVWLCERKRAGTRKANAKRWGTSEANKT